MIEQLRAEIKEVRRERRSGDKAQWQAIEEAREGTAEVGRSVNAQNLALVRVEEKLDKIVKAETSAAAARLKHYALVFSILGNVGVIAMMYYTSLR